VSAASAVTRQLRLDRPAMLAPIFGLHRRGAGDPTHRRIGDVHLRATRTPAGPALTKVVAVGPDVSVRAWGEGAEWALDQLPRLLGEADDVTGFTPRPEHALLVEACRRYGHYRVGRTEAVYEALAPACLEQVVTGVEAFRAWRLLVTEFGEPAPGPW
jgi:3-methyladenine DNA glycosylase/8-oxoguanine DNA glycosylase